MTGIFVSWTDRRNSPGWMEDGTGCHIWLGARSGSGYGQVSVEGAVLYIHRVRYEREVGPIPPDHELDHFACNRGHEGCCNPLHCRPALPRENTLRGNTVTSTNAAKTHCKRGHPLSGPNLIVVPGGRECRACDNARTRWLRRGQQEMAG